MNNHVSEGIVQRVFLSLSDVIRRNQRESCGGKRSCVSHRLHFTFLSTVRSNTTVVNTDRSNEMGFRINFQFIQFAVDNRSANWIKKDSYRFFSNFKGRSQNAFCASAAYSFYIEIPLYLEGPVIRPIVYRCGSKSYLKEPMINLWKYVWWNIDSNCSYVILTWSLRKSCLKKNIRPFKEKGKSK